MLRILSFPKHLHWRPVLRALLPPLLSRLIMETLCVDVRHLLPIILSINTILLLTSSPGFMSTAAIRTTAPPTEQRTVFGQQEWFSKAAVGLTAIPTFIQMNMTVNSFKQLFRLLTEKKRHLLLIFRIIDCIALLLLNSCALLL